jgi:hypothetical protein
MKKNRWQFLCALAVAALTLVSRAQTETESAPERWLFIFDTSSAMKKRLPAVDIALKNMLVNSISQQLHVGDSVAAWTFDEKLRAGEFPLIEWQPQVASQIESNLVTYIRKQHYAGTTKFATIIPSLNSVIKSSERLTILIFCDGMDPIIGTPYNNDINQIFLASHDERKKSKQPFIVLLRTQNGEFVGGAVSFPPNALNLPRFPPLPEPEPIPEPVNSAPPPVVVPKPIYTAPPLIIVGTNVSTNAANLPPINSITAHAETNLATSNATLPPAGNFLASMQTPNGSSSPAAKANGVRPVLVELPTAPQPVDQGAKILLFIGGGFFFAAVALVIILALAMRHRPRGSLISSSMHHDPRQPPRR